MNQPRLAERATPETTAPRASAPPTNGRDTTLGPGLQQLADTLRAQGHSVHTASIHPPWTDDRQLASHAAYFFDQALKLSRATHSRRAHIRVYHSNTSLFLEVTQLRPNSFESATRLTSARDTLDQLNEWSRRHDHPLSIRRGPRDQLRIALLICAATQPVNTTTEIRSPGADPGA